MSRPGLTRRVLLLGSGFAISPAWARGGVAVDVSPLRANGDATDADQFARTLPGYLAESLPGHQVRARIDSVYYGDPGSAGGGHSDGAVDWIVGVGFVDGRAVPLTCSLVVWVRSPDVGGYGGARAAGQSGARPSRNGCPGKRACEFTARFCCLGSGRIGHEVNARGVVEALGWPA